MTDPAPALPPWVQPYEPDFRELLRQLDLVPGFIFQPVVLPSPDLARALADWLATQSFAVRVFDMRHDPWDELGTQLRTLTFDASAERRAVVVITPSNFDRSAARDGLAAFNFSRDSIADHLQCPLLWCGDVQLLRTTAELASDFWSIAATVYRVPLRALADVPYHLGFPTVWWTGAVREDIDELCARLEAARSNTDTRARVDAGLDLAEARLARGELSDASELLIACEPLVRDATPKLQPRWRALQDAVRAATTQPQEAIDVLRRRIEQLRGRGAYHIEAMLRAQLSRLLQSSKATIEAFEELKTARALFLTAKDESAAALLGSMLVVNFYDSLCRDLIEDLRVHALALVSAQPQAAFAARMTCAYLAYHEQRWDEAITHISVILTAPAADDASKMLALQLRSDIASALGEWREVVAIQSELLCLAQSQGTLSVIHDAYWRRGGALAFLSRFQDACADFNASRAVAVQLFDPKREAWAMLAMFECARLAGISEVCAALLARGVTRLIEIKAAIPLDLIKNMSASEEQELAALVERYAADPSLGPVILPRLVALAESRERALEVRGVTLWAPVTWPFGASASSQ